MVSPRQNCSDANLKLPLHGMCQTSSARQTSLGSSHSDRSCCIFAIGSSQRSQPAASCEQISYEKSDESPYPKQEMFSSRIEIVIEQMLQRTNALAVIAFSVYLTATVTFCGSQRLRGDEPLRHRCGRKQTGGARTARRGQKRSSIMDPAIS